MMTPSPAVWHRYVVVDSLTGKSFLDTEDERAALEELRKRGEGHEVRHYAWTLVDRTVLA